MRQFVCAAVLLPAAIMLTAVSAYAQCPSTLMGNPLGVLTGTWEFKLQGFTSNTTPVPSVREPNTRGDRSLAVPTITLNRFVAIIGSFTATYGTTSRSSVPRGILTLTVTVNIDGQLTTGPAIGSFTINPDCSGGTLDLGLGATGLDSFQFIFIDGSSKLYLVNADSRFTVVGEARPALSVSAQCPATLMGNQLGALSGTWGFKLQGFGGSTTGDGFAGIVGTFTATNGVTLRSPFIPQGILALTVTVNLDGQLTTGPATGSFTINPDCSGGTLNLGLGATGLDSYLFVFVNGFKELYLVNEDSRFTILGEAEPAP